MLRREKKKVYVRERGHSSSMETTVNIDNQTTRTTIPSFFSYRCAPSSQTANRRRNMHTFRAFFSRPKKRAPSCISNRSPSFSLPIPNPRFLSLGTQLALAFFCPLLPFFFRSFFFIDPLLIIAPACVYRGLGGTWIHHTFRIRQALILQSLPWQEHDDTKLVGPNHLPFFHPLQFARQVPMVTWLQWFDRDFRTELAQDPEMVRRTVAAVEEASQEDFSVPRDRECRWWVLDPFAPLFLILHELVFFSWVGG